MVNCNSKFAKPWKLILWWREIHYLSSLIINIIFLIGQNNNGQLRPQNPRNRGDYLMVEKKSLLVIINYKYHIFNRTEQQWSIETTKSTKPR